MNTDTIQKTTILKAERARVWRALSDSAEFGQWFGMTFQGPFVPGATVEARVETPGYEGMTATFVIDRVEPETLLSYRWHPYAVDPAVDYSGEPMTLIVFELEDVPGGTRLTVTESGFDSIPAHRRAEALEMNAGGWTAQLVNIGACLAA